MRVATFVVGLLAVLVPVMASWSKEDQEIFRVRDELARALGADVSFYDFVGVPPSASIDEINKAYRKRTRSLHPDKVKQQLAAEQARKTKKDGKSDKSDKTAKTVKGPSAAEVRAAVKKASDMQARLSIVANILRGPERDRYDHFMANGFPVWKGTGYYYSRYRPGFGTVLFGLFIFVGGGAHYLALYTGWKRQRDFMDRYIRRARTSAWGDNLGVNLGAADPAGSGADPGAAGDDPSVAAPPAAALNRKQRRMQERESKREDQRSNSSGRRTAARKAGRGAGGGGGGGTSSSAHASGTATPVTSPTGGGGGGPTGPKKRVVAENGKVLIVDSLGDVYLEQIDDEGNVEELLLDINTINPPTFRDTAVYRLPAWLYALAVGRVLSGKPAGSSDEAAAAGYENNEVEDEASSAGKQTPSTDSNEEFELLGASTELLNRARATGSSNNKPARRKGKR